MNIELIIRMICQQIRKLALILGMEFDEVLEWVRREENNILPWEE